MANTEHLSSQPVAKASMLIRKPAADLFEAFVDPDITSKFWFTRASDRLDAGRNVTWYWDHYEVSAEVVPQALDKYRQISWSWPAQGGINTNVVIMLSPRGEQATFMTIEEKGWDAATEKINEILVGQTEGWSFVLAGLKAWLEHGIQLNLVADHNPKAM
ncbi:SRPBCC domain-containing protein [Paraflavitalea sp. CAU 1676]|uniref:SRPBCC domain-containing protein n=1 Tax=Paraflavitalea sp. CAU 1676 TaxID=3032598 RepID=UPI0023DBB9C6|nr:SRPBCC domain-containing protein [Paraflavitalea sp. CAU 1676]MDF2186786.1 SRPBCC domain-containing protein [Paraflavitalea sp. CAU 1676]